MRIALSLIQLPVYLFALAISPNFTESRLLWSFLIIHVFIYPAGNTLIIYFKEGKSKKDVLLYLALLLEILAIVIGIIKISWVFASLALIYGLFIKAYSHPLIKLKKYPLAGWLVHALTHGFMAFMISYVGINNYGLDSIFQTSIIIPALITMVWQTVYYPMLQIYFNEQPHSEKVILIQALLIQVLAAVCFLFYYESHYPHLETKFFILSLIPTITYLLVWFFKISKNKSFLSKTFIVWFFALAVISQTTFLVWWFFAITHLDQYLF